MAAAFVSLLDRADFSDDRAARPTGLPHGGQVAGGRSAGRRGCRIAAVKGHVQLAYPIENTDRAVGTRLAGEVAAMVGDAEPPGSLEVRLSGTAGQSFGAFLVPGVTMRLAGTANDYVAKGMAGGTVVAVPEVSDPGGLFHGGGYTFLYGATGGAAVHRRRRRAAVCGPQLREPRRWWKAPPTTAANT